jgi:hypothetical protein
MESGWSAPAIDEQVRPRELAGGSILVHEIRPTARISDVAVFVSDAGEH